MSFHLTPSDRTRLVKLLGMLGSAHDGERASAGLLATRLLRDRGLSWDDLLQPRLPPPKTDSRPQWPASADWRTQVAVCRVQTHLFNAWEQKFLHGLPRLRRLSLRQHEILAKLRDRARSAGGGQ
jgi:hypothetical protein